MRKFIAITSALTVALGLPAIVAAQAAQAKPEPPKAEAKAPASIAGKWKMNLDVGGNAMELPVEFKQDGTKVTGTVTGPDGSSVPLEGQLADGKLSFSLTTPDGQPITFNATVKDENTMTGSFDMQGNQVSFTIARVKS